MSSWGVLDQMVSGHVWPPLFADGRIVMLGDGLRLRTMWNHYQRVHALTDIGTSTGAVMRASIDRDSKTHARSKLLEHPKMLAFVL